MPIDTQYHILRPTDATQTILDQKDKQYFWFFLKPEQNIRGFAAWPAVLR